MSKELVKASEIPGPPKIGGSVRMNLHELDTLRADYVKTLNLCKELQENQMNVKVTIEEKKHIRDFIDGGDRYNGYKNRYTEHIEFLEIGHAYKNLDEIREVIRSEEEDKLLMEMDSLRNALRKSEEKALKFSEHIDTLNNEIQAYRSRITTLEHQVKTDENTIKACTMKIEEEVKELQQSNEMNKRLLDAVEELKKQKSIWYWLQQQFTVKNAH